MADPFEKRNPGLTNQALDLAGPATDLVPVIPDDDNDLTSVATSLYVETGGTVVVDTVAGNTRTVLVASFGYLPVGVRRVRATGTTATGIHALLVP